MAVIVADPFGLRLTCFQIKVENGGQADTNECERAAAGEIEQPKMPLSLDLRLFNLQLTARISALISKVMNPH